MVVRNLKNVKTKKMDSKSLKFGMDRILSENIFSANGKSEVPVVSPPPCAGCISSLYRCCRGSPALGNGNYYRNEIHAPQPLRPYTNAESDIHQSNQQPVPERGGTKRKRSWSRAVFSNLQRKGLEKRFQLQKYITKPDRRQLAATLGLTDAQKNLGFLATARKKLLKHLKWGERDQDPLDQSIGVPPKRTGGHGMSRHRLLTAKRILSKNGVWKVKVWFQNRRMKWRHTKESTGQSQAMKDSGENILVSADSTQTPITDSEGDSDVDVQTVDV